MSEYCDIFPEDPTCAAEEEEVVIEDEEVVIEDEETADVEGDDEEVDAEEMDGETKEEMEDEMMGDMKEKMEWDMTPSQMWMKAGELMKFASINPFMGEITYLMVAIGVATHTALDLFRYEDSDVLDTYKTSSTNWFKLGSMIRKYTYVAVFGIAALTQILAGLGIAPGINMLVWFYGVMFAGTIASSLGFLFKYLGYEGGYCADDDTDCATELAKYKGSAYAVRSSMIEDVIFDTSFTLALYMEGENWMWAQWDAATQEEKETKLEELMAEIEEWDAEKMAEMEGEMKEEKSEDADEEDAEEEVAEEEDAEEEVAEEEDAEEEE